jgi:hypothetical protein
MFTGDGCCPPFVPLAEAYCIHRERFNELDIRDTVATRSFLQLGADVAASTGQPLPRALKFSPLTQSG